MSLARLPQLTRRRQDEQLQGLQRALSAVQVPVLDEKPLVSFRSTERSSITITVPAALWAMCGKAADHAGQALNAIVAVASPPRCDPVVVDVTGPNYDGVHETVQRIFRQARESELHLRVAWLTSYHGRLQRKMDTVVNSQLFKPPTPIHAVEAIVSEQQEPVLDIWIDWSNIAVNAWKRTRRRSLSLRSHTSSAEAQRRPEGPQAVGHRLAWSAPLMRGTASLSKVEPARRSA